MTRKSETSPVDFFLEDDVEPPAIVAVADIAQGWTAVLRWELNEGRLELTQLGLGDWSAPQALGLPKQVEGDLGNMVGVTRITDAFEHRRGRSSARTGPLTVRMIRDLPLGELELQARAHMARTESIAKVVGQDISGAARKRPGRRGRPDSFYADVAAAYVAALNAGVPKPVEHVAGLRFLSASQVRNLLHEARRRDLLTRPGGGKAGGQLTAKGRAALTDQEGTHGLD